MILILYLHVLILKNSKFQKGQNSVYNDPCILKQTFMQLLCCSLHILLRNINILLDIREIERKKKNKETLAKQNALITSFEKKN